MHEMLTGKKSHKKLKEIKNFAPLEFFNRDLVFKVPTNGNFNRLFTKTNTDSNQQSLFKKYVA